MQITIACIFRIFMPRPLSKIFIKEVQNSLEEFIKDFIKEVQN